MTPPPPPFLPLLGPEISDAYTESVDLFSTKPSSRNLGFFSRTASTLSVDIGPHTLTIHQSPTLLCSALPGGTTGSVLWGITPRVARFLPGSPLVPASSSVLELGAGVSGLLALSCARRVARYILSDQTYVLKLLRRNVDENLGVVLGRRGAGALISVIELDWETDDVASHPALQDVAVDVVVACDCIYNEALVQPFVETCADVARLHGAHVVVAQELRSQDVFDAWLEAFAAVFRVWRVPDSILTEELRSGEGYVLHVGVLREEEEEEEE